MKIISGKLSSSPPLSFPFGIGEFPALCTHPDEQGHREVHFDNTGREHQQVLFLRRLTDRMAMADPLPEVLDEVVNFISSATQGDSCSIFVGEAGDLVLHASTSPQSPPIAGTKLGESSGEQFETFLSVPLVGRLGTVGVITLQKQISRQYGDTELNLLATLGFLLGAEIERIQVQGRNLNLRRLVKKATWRAAAERRKHKLTW